MNMGKEEKEIYEWMEKHKLAEKVVEAMKPVLDWARIHHMSREETVKACGAVCSSVMDGYLEE